jgi:hypothetical protein
MTKYTIYEIRPIDKTNNFSYIGSTSNFIKRKSSHKTDCYNEKRKKYMCKLYVFIRDNNGWENFEMVPLDEISCDTKLQARIREQEWIISKQTISSLNSIKAYISNKEKKENDAEYKEVYYNMNKEYILDKNKQYYDANRDVILKQRKEYYHLNKETILNKQNVRCSESITCCCGSNFRRDSKIKHLKTKKHQLLISDCQQE